MASGDIKIKYGLYMISISRYYAQGNVSQDQYIQFIRHDTLGFEYLDQSKNFAPQVILVCQLIYFQSKSRLIFMICLG